METVLDALDLVGTFVFALSGALAGQRRGTDLFGMMVLAFVTATAGGVLRDVIVGSVPPTAFTSWHPLAVCLAAGLIVYCCPTLLERVKHVEQVFDAAGLGVFAATGTQLALGHGIDPIMAAVLGMVSGIGGGALRDMLTGQVPLVLRGQIYALAALAAATVVLAGSLLGAPSVVSALVATVVCLLLRLTAIYRRWDLPSADRRVRAR